MVTSNKMFLYNITTRSGMEVTRLNEMNTWLIFERFYQLGKGFRSSEGKLGVTTHFSEIINVQFGKNALYIVMYFNGFLFLEILLLNFLWVRGYAQFSFWIPTALTEICFSRKVTSDGKILLDQEALSLTEKTTALWSAAKPNTHPFP